MVYGILLFLILLFNSLLALLVLVKNYKNHINISFFIFTSAIVMWIASNYFSNQALSYESAFLANKLIFIFSIYIVFGLFYFSLVFPTNTLTVTWRKLLIMWVPFLISNVLTVSNQVITGVSFLKEGGTGVDFGFGIVYFTILFISFFFAAVVILIKKYLKSSGYNRVQLQYLLFGIGILMVFGTITNLIMPLLFNSYESSNYGPFFSLSVVGFTTYAIVRHRLLDIRLIIARSVAYSLLILLVGAIYSLGLFAAGSLFVGTTVTTMQLFFSTFLALIMALSFQYIRRIIEKLTDKILYKGKYNTNKLLYELALIMASTLRLDDLTVQVLKQLLTQMRISNGGFVLVDKGNLYRIFTEGFKQELKIDKSQLKVLYKYETFIFDEIPEGEVKETMRQLNFKVVIPLKTQNEETGILILGDKLSGDIYTSEDIRVLETLAPEIAIAVQNAKAFEEIKKFNITLQQEVDKATKSLQIANQKLKQLDLLKDDFVSVASHELRTPMTAIRSYVWMALHKSDVPLSQKLERYLFRTLVSTERLINLVNDMLNVSRIESGKIEITPKVFDIMALVKDVVEEVKVKAEEKKLTITVLEHAIPQVFADVDKIHQILLNLIGNSLKFCYPSGLITIDFLVSEKVIEISIKDNGAGIAKDDLAKLFHKFSRLDSSYTAVGTSGGTGLGLYISKSLIELMHGQIKAFSEGVDKGTTMTFSLPIATKELIASSEKYHIKPEGGEAKLLEPVAI